MYKTLSISALGIFLFSNVSAANIESVFLPKDLNQCMRSLDLPYSMHTERIEEDRLGASYYVNPFLNVQMMLIAADLDDVGCGKSVMRYTTQANNLYDRIGKYAVYGRTDGTLALNRLGHFVRQPWFFYGGL